MAKVKFEIDIRGARTVQANLRRAGLFGRKAADKFAREIAADLLARSQAIAPVFRGELVATGQVISTRGGYTVAYGTDHAVFAHEVISPTGEPGLTAGGTLRYGVGPITLRKPATEDGPAGGKFLERPFNRSRRQMPRSFFRRVLDTIRKVLR